MESRRRGRQLERTDDKGLPKRARSVGSATDFWDGQFQGQQQSGHSPRPVRSTPSQTPSRRPAGTSQTGAGSDPSSQPRFFMPLCPLCGKRHSGECFRSTGACFVCGRQGHRMRDCPDRVGAEGSGQASGTVGASSSASVAMHPTGRGTPVVVDRDRGRDGAPGSSGPTNRIYALTSRQDQEASPNVIAGTDTQSSGPPA